MSLKDLATLYAIALTMAKYFWSNNKSTVTKCRFYCSVSTSDKGAKHIKRSSIKSLLTQK